MRGTTHNGRAGKNGVYSVKHNDRNFDVNSAEHIDKDRMCGNWYWQRYQKDQDMTFEDCEKKFYAENFKESLTAKNERYRKAGHKERMKTMDEYRKNRQSCPEETLLQVGKTGDTIDPNLLKQICIEHINWEMKTFPNVKVLNAALHIDEEGAPHVHERKVWIAHSDDGLVVGQAKALNEMKIQRPHPEKKKDRYNNPKTTYTAMCREHFIQICKEHGLEIELEPDKASKRGLELTEYKRKQEQEKIEKARQELDKVIKETDQMKEEIGVQATKLLDTAEQIKQLLDSGKRGLLDKDKVTVSGKELEECLGRIKDFTRTSAEQINAAKERLAKERERIQEEESRKAQKQIIAYQNQMEVIDRDRAWTEKQLKDLAKRYPKQVAEYAKSIGNKSLLSMVDHQNQQRNRNLER